MACLVFKLDKLIIVDEENLLVVVEVELNSPGACLQLLWKLNLVLDIPLILFAVIDEHQIAYGVARGQNMPAKYGEVVLVVRWLNVDDLQLHILMVFRP
jgi:hypothetical protein